MKKSTIEWTEATWNPVTGCDRVTAGCDNCYALALAKRLKAMGAEKYQNDGNPTTSGPGFGVTTHPEVLAQPAKWKRPTTVFVNSMSDLFHARVPKPFIHDVFEVMSATPQHTYQILTKRPTRLRRMAGELPWPENVWIGTSVEEPKVLDRVAELAQVPAAVRFLSCEPLIAALPDLPLDHIDWVIAGGESGPRHREMQTKWVRDIRDQCLTADVPFFFKQWGGRTPKQNGRELDGRLWDGYPRADNRGTRGAAQH